MYRKTVLPNGLRIVTEVVPHVQSVTVGLWALIGSRDEPPTQNGIAHFVEHMLFKGTRTRDALAISKAIDSVGGVLNAFTTREHTCIYAKVRPQHTELAIDVLSDAFLHSTFEPEELEKERKVILQEISMVEDTPDDWVHDLFSQSFWPDHPLGRPIQGTAEVLEALTRDDLIRHFERYFCPEGLVIAAAGALDHDEIVRLVERYFVLERTAPRPAPQPAPRPVKNVTIRRKNLEQVHLCLGTVGIPQTHPLREAGYLLNAILGGGMSSRLFQEIREKRGLAYSVYSFLTTYANAGQFGVYAGTGPENVAQVIELILTELRAVKENSVTAAELESAKEQLKGSFLLSLESTDARMDRLAKNEIYYGRHFDVAEVVAEIDRVTLDDLHALAAEILGADTLSLAVLGRVRKGSLTPDLLSL
ncbi:MAG TPA: pitrilysin family protein [Thermodesulfobacteriota bacterium]|nr:pitrilysin family protein [Thermodesulfobacteriota bacterium]